MSNQKNACSGKQQPETVKPDELKRICEAYAKVFFPRRPHDPTQPRPEELAEVGEHLDKACAFKLPTYQSPEYQGPVYVVVWASGPGCVSVFVENDDASLRYVALEIFD